MIVSKSSPTTTSRVENCCEDPNCGAGLRNQYFDGKRLTPASFRFEQAYGIEHRRLLNRAIHGWGLVYGYAIHPQLARDSPVAASQRKMSHRRLFDHSGR